MYCNFCNSQLPEGVFVCAVCGHDNTPVQSAPVAHEPEAYTSVVVETPVIEETAYEPEEASAFVEAPKAKAKAKKTDDPLSNGITALVWGALSALMSFGGLFFAMSPYVAIAGIIMSLVSKKKAKLAKAFSGTVGASLAKGADAASTFGLIASIYTLVMYFVVIAILIFIYVLYFFLIMIGVMASSGTFYYYY